jgi:hypothetical protein
MFLDQRSFEPPAAGTVLDLHPQFRIPGRYADHCLRFVDALARSQLYDFFVAVAPRTEAAPNDPSTVAAYDSVEHDFTVVPGSLIWGITSVSDQAAGFRFDIRDVGQERPVSIVKATNGALSGDIGVSAFGTPTPFLFDVPYIITGLGLVNVRITNLAAVANALQLCIFIAQPKTTVEAQCQR